MATGYFVFAIFQLLINSDLVKFDKAKLKDVSENLKLINESLEEQGKELAKKMKGKTPVIYANVHFKAVANIWKIKINENAKTPAFWNYFPELNHNEMVGFTNPQAEFFFVMLLDKEDHPQNIKRFEVMKSLMEKRGMQVEIIEMKGANVFEKVFASLCLGDWASYYLALEYGIDPTPVDMVEEFKELIK
jgi:glucose/mannose-6-phosphate isomerase